MKAHLNSIMRGAALLFIAGNCALGLKASSELLNSYAEARRYNEVCWLTAHNAFASVAEGWQFENQNLSFKAQHQLGVRSFMLDVYWHKPVWGEGYIALCHELAAEVNQYVSYCFGTLITRLGREPQSLESYFAQIKEWLDENPEEIITLHLESYLGPEGAAGLRKLLKDTGLEPYLYADKYPSLLTNLEQHPG